MANFYETINEAIADIEQFGFDSQERIDRWIEQIRASAHRDMISGVALEKMLDYYIRRIYAAQIEKGGILKTIKVERFRLENVKPKLRAELDRRIMSSSRLIKLNREEMIHRTIQRFSGWVTSISVGGSDAVKSRQVSDDLRKSMRQLPFVERRVMIDQGHKFLASLNEILAMDNNPIAMIWHSNWRQANYNYRKDHKERDKQIFVIKGNWALDRGLMKLDKHEYYDNITHVGTEIFCRCYAEWVFHLRELPESMLTKKGKESLGKKI